MVTAHSEWPTRETSSVREDVADLQRWMTPDILISFRFASLTSLLTLLSNLPFLSFNLI